MKLIYGFPFNTCPPYPDFIDGGVIRDLARQAEGRGYDGVFLTEHPAPSQVWPPGHAMPESAGFAVGAPFTQAPTTHAEGLGGTLATSAMDSTPPMPSHA